MQKVRPRSLRGGLDPYVALGLLAALAFFVVSGGVAFLNVNTLYSDTNAVMHTHEVLTSLDRLLSTLKDAETGQRGYLLTGDDRYLQPYNDATGQVNARLASLRGLVANDSAQTAKLSTLERSVSAKMVELKETVDIRRTSGLPAALAVVVSDRGKGDMDAARAIVGEMGQTETAERDHRRGEVERAFGTAVASGISTAVVGILLTGALAYLLMRTSNARALQDWLQTGRAGLAAAMLGDQRTEQLGERILKFFGDYLGIHAGAVFVREAQVFTRVSSYGLALGGKSIDRFALGETLLGQAAADTRTIVMRDVPDNLMTVGSALVQGAPHQIVITPATSEGAVNAVVELGFMRKLDDYAVALLEQMSEAIGVAVRSARYRGELQKLLEETQRQSEELATQGEELRVSNEELEEQTRALKESQSRLENQQAELEQINAHLESQSEQLERQRDNLLAANETVAEKARELEQASRYKSDFLANMSHELRTPLNSLLILAKLIADNPQDNLTDDQIRYAKTIYSSGNDLLVLINDILDLSKIEAGHVEIKPEPFSVARFMDSIKQTFEPIAANKSLDFRVSVEASCPQTLHTDRQRVEQIVKNLLSNAIKFTERGSVELRIGSRPNDEIGFSVVDTGIGISEDQQARVFEAFQQADGTISRKFGGTGLGLSISRELARLLGGAIALQSLPGRGSTFSLTIPQVFVASATAESPVPTLAPERPAPIEAPPIPRVRPRPAARIEDDRERLSGGKRVLLVVEDDPSFARILQDFSRELDFESLVAGTAEEALALAREYNPHAIVLDVGLPDHSGLSVLDELKRDIRTRHIPVHVVSASENAKTALSLGAIGYLMKPVEREDLLAALRKLEGRLNERLRRVLIVEDDDVQREAVTRLLEAEDVEITSAGTAEECLEKLKQQTFDCMVLDLTLPDASGYALLERLSREDAYSFPPVIVYTGHDLSADEEQQLRRYSHSIIIKGAKSPERLLDEVTLFLHQVVSGLPEEKQKLLKRARSRDEALEGRRILVVEDDVRNIYALTSVLEPRGVLVQIARNGEEAVQAIAKSAGDQAPAIDLVLMDVMMPVMDGLTATREIRKDVRLRKLPIIVLTAKAMQDDQERCLEAGANDYMAKPLDVEKLLSLVRVWMPR